MATSRYAAELIANAKAISAPGKGILAADESTGTIGKRFDAIQLPNNEENRRAYRDLLFSCPGELEKYISGVILYEETFHQKSAAGVPFVELLKSRGIIPGIKVDAGTVVIAGSDGETATQGLDKLGERCAKFYAGGARFAKWRAVIKISDKAPSEMAIIENAHGLARYAQICQENGLVPIVEPEVLMDGPHSIERSAAVSEKVQAAVFKYLSDFNVLLEGILLKPNMVLQGYDAAGSASPQDVARYTVQTLMRTVPPAVPGIMFLSGGQSEEEATVNLNAINALMNSLGKRTWALSFSYGRALQSSTIKTWGGKVENVAAAQAVLLARAKADSEASLGKYGGGAAGSAAGAAESLYEKGYTY